MAFRPSLLAAALAILLPQALPALEFKFQPNSYPHLNIASVHLAGGFNGWKPDATPFEPAEDATLVADLELPDGEHQYKLVLATVEGDVHWVLDPANPVYKPDGLGGFNSAAFIKEGKRAAPPASYEAFKWEDAEAKTVCVSGDFCEWQADYLHLRKDAKGVWRAWIELPRPITYKYVINGEKWSAEPAADGIEIVGEEGNNFRGYRHREPESYESPGEPAAP